MSIYRIRRGDTLSVLAIRHGLSIQELARLNGISDIHKIYAGRDLIVRDRTSNVPTSRADKARTPALVNVPI